ncbi:MAG: chloride channel protein [Cetobacterium sp.]
MNEKLFYLKCTFVGILTGIIVITYRVLLDKINLWRKDFFQNLKLDITFNDMLGIVIFIILSSCFLGYITKNYPMTRGGGVGFVKADVEDNIDFSSSNKVVLRDILYRLIGAVTALSSGLSFGIEGPAIELGAETGQAIGNASNSQEKEKKYLVTSGAAAGLSAAFNAPLTGMIFALEQIMNNISTPHIMAIFISTTIVSGMTYKVFGLRPFFDFQLLDVIRLQDYYVIVIFSLITTIMGKCYFKLASFFENMNKRIKLPDIIKPIVPITIAIFVSYYFFYLTGEGYIIANKIIFNDFSLSYLVVILVAKLIYFVYSSSTFIPGGSFVPLISIGAILGKIYGLVIVKFFNFPNEYIICFIVLGMSLLMTSIFRAPITSVVLIVEITGATNLFYPLAIGTIFVMLFSSILKMNPLYDSALKKYIGSIHNLKRKD